MPGEATQQSAAANGRDQLGVATLGDLITCLLQHAVGFGGGELFVQFLQLGHDHVVSFVRAQDALLLLVLDDLLLRLLDLRFQLCQLFRKPFGSLCGGLVTSAEILFQIIAHQGVDHVGGKLGVAIEEAHLDHAGSGKDLYLQGFREMRAKSCGDAGALPPGQFLLRAAAVGDEPLVHEGEFFPLFQSELLGDLEGERVGAQGVRLGLEREVVVQAVAGGGLQRVEPKISEFSLLTSMMDTDSYLGVITSEMARAISKQAAVAAITVCRRRLSSRHQSRRERSG